MYGEDGPTRVLLAVSDRQGYSADQVRETMTLGDLMSALEAAIEEYGPDVQVVTFDGDEYGAAYGGLDPYRDLFQPVPDEEEEDEEEE